MTRTLPFVVLFLIACGGSSQSETPEPIETTSGGEAEPPPPAVMRTTTPVPVPQPAIAREEMSEPLQQLWEKVELAIADAPPEPPAVDTSEAISEWAEGPLSTWISGRAEANREVTELGSQLLTAEAPIYERVVAAALSGYLLEDTAAVIRGAPVPVTISSDPELLQIYVDSLTEVTHPLAQMAFEAFAFCTEHGAVELRETPWVEWATYCYQRAEEVSTTFELSSGEAAGEAAEPDADPADMSEEGEVEESGAEQSAEGQANS